MAQLEHIEAIEKRLWKAADTLRSNSPFASNEYFMPIMGLIFLRHAYSRFLAVRPAIIESLPKRGGQTRPLTKEDFSRRGAIYLKDEAQYAYLASLPDSANRAQAIIRAMESIEADYASLKGQLPKKEYETLTNEVLGQLLRDLNPEELKHVSGDVFGRIYEYFLTQFASEKAHDGGEFFTPVSLVSLIANVLEPESGIVLDPACGSGGMFVQSARVVEHQSQRAAEKLTFYGLEKNGTTINLARMNLAVHGLEGNIQQAITYYQDHAAELVGKADYVMANPPFNVDEIDAEKIKADPRLCFGLPGVNKSKRVSNGNYVWISYFYSYLNPTGKAGFVMSSQASSAGGEEAKVRQRIIETGDVDAMIAIRSNFFYTRTVPCELWFFNKAKPAEHKDKVLMVDARHIYHKVTRAIMDFSPEQEQNILAIFHLYRGQTERYLELLRSYIEQAAAPQDTMQAYTDALDEWTKSLAAVPAEYADLRTEFDAAARKLAQSLSKYAIPAAGSSNKELKAAYAKLEPIADAAHALAKMADALYTAVNSREISGGRASAQLRTRAEEATKQTVLALDNVRYYRRQTAWLIERFPDAELCDVPGLCKLVDRAEIAANDWSLTPGRYVGVAPEEEDEDFDFEQTMRDIHSELAELNADAVRLADTIQRNLAELI